MMHRPRTLTRVRVITSVLAAMHTWSYIESFPRGGIRLIFKVLYMHICIQTYTFFRWGVPLSRKLSLAARVREEKGLSDLEFRGCVGFPGRNRTAVTFILFLLPGVLGGVLAAFSKLSFESKYSQGVIQRICCWVSCFKFRIISHLLHVSCLGSCLMSCLWSSFMLHGMLHIYSMFQASWHASCCMFDDSYFMFHVMPHVMLLRVMFYGMHVVSCHVSFMSYRVKALTKADINGVRLQ